MMSTVHHSEKTLLLGLELSNRSWRLAFDNGEKIRQVTVASWDQDGFRSAVATAKAKLKLPPETPVCSCYEAGRDGFGIHRFLASEGIVNVVVDPASIEVNRRHRRCKTDRLDAAKLVTMLRRYHGGERTLWQVLRVPSEDEEDRRRLHRERERLLKERGQHRSRLRSLICLHGVQVASRVPPQSWDVASLRTWRGDPLGPDQAAEIVREQQRLKLVEEQLETFRQRLAEELVADASSRSSQQVHQLVRLRSIGLLTAWILSREFFAWRHFRNRREVAAAAGLCGAPYASGDSCHDQGLTKAGNPRIRTLMIELAWSWLRFQPESELSRWYHERFGHNKRSRMVGIAALARRLLIALWRYLEFNELPAGALLSEG
jgi:transposase